MRKHVLQRWFPRIVIYEGGREEAWAAGWNGQNNGLRIRIWSGIDHFAAVLSQERFEWAFKWSVGLIPALFMKRRIEFLGHAVECIVAARWYNANLQSKIAEETRSLEGYSQFKGWSHDDIRAGLVKAFPAAERWVREHQNTIQLDYLWRANA